MKTEIHKTIQIKQANAGRKPISRLSQIRCSSLHHLDQICTRNNTIELLIPLELIEMLYSIEQVVKIIILTERLTVL